MITFSKLKIAGLPKASAKFSKLGGIKKAPNISIKDTKIPMEKNLKSFDFTKYTKTPKLPKQKKVTILKKAIKAVKK